MQEVTTKTKKIVKRGVTELITPGVSMNDEVLSSRVNNFLASVFFGDSVSKEVVDLGFSETSMADAVIVIGSSLMVFSSFRFVRHAFEQNKPIYCLNRGKTRADDMFTVKAEVDVSHGLSAIVDF